MYVTRNDESLHVELDLSIPSLSIRTGQRVIEYVGRPCLVILGLIGVHVHPEKRFVKCGWYKIAFGDVFE